jgi:GAF domain-containing protein
VNLFTTRGGDKKVSKQIGISRDGSVPENNYYCEKETGLVAWCMSNLEPIVINDISLDDELISSPFEQKIQSELVLPLLHGDLLIGVLDLCSDITNVFNPKTVKMFQVLANHIAVAIRNANLYQVDQMKILIYDRLQKAVGLLSADVFLDDVIQNILDEVEKNFVCDAASIWLADTSANEAGIGQFSSSLRLAAARSMGQLSEESDQSQSLDTTYLLEQYLQNPAESIELFSIYPWISEVINSKILMIRESTSTFDPLGAILDYKSDYSAIGAPLIINDQPVGIIVLAHHLPDQYDGEIIYKAQTFTKYASIAI